jgi:excisionase family DNA binding protein
MTQKNHKYYKPQEVADILNVNRETILRMCRNPELKFGTKIGNLWRISEQDLEELKKTKKRED